MNVELVLFWSSVVLVASSVAVVAIVVTHAALRSRAATFALYRRHFTAPRRERLFLSSAAFFLTFVVVRALTHAIRLGLGPFHNISHGGVHIHHLVWGILLLLLVGYLWLIQIGGGSSGSSAASRITAILYGLGAALTLDEFALWLRLEDVYWTREGRQSVEVVILFGGLLSVGLWGGRFFRSLISEASRRARVYLLRRR